MELLTRLINGLVTNLDLVTAAIAMWLVVALGAHRASELVDDRRSLERLETWLVVGIVVAARIAYVVPSVVDYAIDPASLIRINQGLSLFGALGGGAFVLLLYARRRRIDLPRLLDLFAVFVPLGIALHSYGCIAYGYCGGMVTQGPFGMHLPGQLGRRYPSSLVEGTYALGLFFLFLRLQKRGVNAGSITLLLLLLLPPAEVLIGLTRYPAGLWPWWSNALAGATTASALIAAVARRTERRRRNGRVSTPVNAEEGDE